MSINDVFAAFFSLAADQAEAEALIPRIVEALRFLGIIAEPGTIEWPSSHNNWTFKTASARVAPMRYR